MDKKRLNIRISTQLQVTKSKHTWILIRQVNNELIMTIKTTSVVSNAHMVVKSKVYNFTSTVIILSWIKSMLTGRCLFWEKLVTEACSEAIITLNCTLLRILMFFQLTTDLFPQTHLELHVFFSCFNTLLQHTTDLLAFYFLQYSGETSL